MALGYSREVERAVRGADQSLLGVQLGVVCLGTNTPVADIALWLGVSRATVYNWFKGIVQVPHTRCIKVRTLIKALRKLPPNV